MLPVWISGAELLERWKIKGIELCSIVQEGLQPYTELGELKPSPDVTEKSEKLKEVRKKLAEYEVTPKYGTLKYDEKLGQYCPDENEYAANDMFREEREQLHKEASKLKSHIGKVDYSWKGYDLPSDNDAVIAIVNDLVKSLFMLEDVKVHAKEQDFKAFETADNISSTPKALVNDNNGRQARPEDMGSYVFWQENKERWFVRYGNCEDRVEHVGGMKYIAIILGMAPKPFYPETIMGAKAFIEEESNTGDGDGNGNVASSEDKPSNDDKNIDVYSADHMTIKKNVHTEEVSPKEIKDIRNGIGAWLKRSKKMDGDKKIDDEKKLKDWIKETSEEKSLKITISKNGQVSVTRITSIEVTRARDNCKKQIENVINKMSKSGTLTELAKHFKEDEHLSFKLSEFRYRNENIKWVVNYLD